MKELRVECILSKVLETTYVATKAPFKWHLKEKHAAAGNATTAENRSIWRANISIAYPIFISMVCLYITINNLLLIKEKKGCENSHSYI